MGAGCRKCYGAGRVPDRLWGTSKLCHECNGVGYRVLGACFKCNGTRRVPGTLWGENKCHECNGVGSKILGGCSKCNGTGKVPGRDRTSGWIELPAFIENLQHS